MQKVYKTTGLSILGALGSAYTVLSIPLSAAALSQLSLVGLITGVIGLIGSSYMKPEYHVIYEQLNNREKTETIVARNSFMRSALFGMGVIGLGVSSAPLFAFANMVSPTILPTALGMTAAIFGGASLAAYNMPKDKMLSYGPALGGSLLGLIALQLVGLGASLIVGPNPYSMMMFSASNYISVALFTAFVAYDTHVSIKMYEMGEPDHMQATIQFVLDFWNLLTSLLSIMSRD